MEDTQEEITGVEVTETQGLEIGVVSQSFLSQIGKWTQFLSILGFVGIGLALLGSVVVVFMLSQGGTVDLLSDKRFSIVTLYFALIAISFFPILYLFNFSKKIKQAISTKDNKSIDEAFMNLKSHYKFLGILAIIVIGIYILFAMLGGLAFVFTGS